jgi:hypothetical protein
MSIALSLTGFHTINRRRPKIPNVLEKIDTQEESVTLQSKGTTPVAEHKDGTSEKTFNTAVKASLVLSTVNVD